MSESQPAAAPESGDTPHPSPLPQGERDSLDPEIAALLDFQPVPRKTAPPGAWTPEAQRQYIARLAVTGSQGKACGEIGKDRGGATKLYRSPEAGSFRAAWHAAIELYQRRQAEKLSKGPPPALQPPTVDGRRKAWSPPAVPAPEAPRPPALRDPLTVVCDSCAATGIAGDPNFTRIADILAFDPVRASLQDRDWDEELQRAFIASLAVTGSPAKAARTIGRHELGAERLRKMRGGRGFAEAWEAAIEIAREREFHRRSAELRQLDGADADERASWHFREDPFAEDIDEVRERLVQKLIRLKARTAAEDQAGA